MKVDAEVNHSDVNYEAQRVSFSLPKSFLAESYVDGLAFAHHVSPPLAEDSKMSAATSPQSVRVRNIETSSVGHVDFTSYPKLPVPARLS